jgi:hypothetical protein
MIRRIGVVALLSLTVAACDEGDDGTTAAEGTAATSCEYDAPPPYTDARQIEVSGGATCRDAIIMVKLGPEFGVGSEAAGQPIYLDGEPVLQGSSWTCDVNQPMPDRQFAQPVRCEDGPERVEYLFYPESAGDAATSQRTSDQVQINGKPVREAAASYCGGIGQLADLARIVGLPPSTRSLNRVAMSYGERLASNTRDQHGGAPDRRAAIREAAYEGCLGGLVSRD